MQKTIAVGHELQQLLPVLAELPSSHLMYRCLGNHLDPKAIEIESQSLDSEMMPYCYYLSCFG